MYFVIYKEIESAGSLMFKLFIRIQIHLSDLNSVSWNWGNYIHIMQAIAIVLLNYNKQEISDDVYYNNPQYFVLVSIN